MNFFMDPDSVKGLAKQEKEQLRELIKIFNAHQSKNAEKEKYYEGNISLAEVNLGLALPNGMRKLEIGCAWGAKAVDVLAARSKLDGFVDLNGSSADELNDIVSENRLLFEYAKACRDELKYGCTFATMSKNKIYGCKIRFHSPRTAAAKWNGEKGRIDSGFAIIDTVQDDSLRDVWVPKTINLYTETATWIITRVGGDMWEAFGLKNETGRPLMEPLIWNATSNKPFGRSRIKEPIRRLIQGYVRTMANATIGLEFATSPQKYLLGVTDDQYDAIVNDKFRQYVGSIIASTYNPDTGEKPSFGQLQQGTLSPHIEMMRLLATQFSAATGLSVTDTGIVNDANPTSSEAIIAQEQTLILMAEELNKGNGEALKNIIMIALALKNNTSIEKLTDGQKSIVAHFKNPAMPSLSVTADAAMKTSQARPGFSDTDVYLEMVGFEQADIRRIRSQERAVRGMKLLTETEEGKEQTADAESVQVETEE